MKKVLMLLLSMVLILGMVGLSFADKPEKNDPDGIDDWRGNSTLLTNAETSVKDVGRAADNLVMTVGKIIASVMATWIGIKKLGGGKTAQNKTDLKEDALKLIVGSTVIFFGIDILIKVLNLIKSAFFA